MLPESHCLAFDCAGGRGYKDWSQVFTWHTLLAYVSFFPKQYIGFTGFEYF